MTAFDSHEANADLFAIAFYLRDTRDRGSIPSVTVRANFAMTMAIISTIDSMDAQAVSGMSPAELAKKIAQQRAGQEDHDFPFDRCERCGGRMEESPPDEGGDGRVYTPGWACEECGHFESDEHEPDDDPIPAVGFGDTHATMVAQTGD